MNLVIVMSVVVYSFKDATILASLYLSFAILDYWAMSPLDLSISPLVVVRGKLDG